MPVGSTVRLVEESTVTRDSHLVLGETYIVKKHGDGFIYVDDGIKCALASRFEFISEPVSTAPPARPYPKFDWDNFDREGCTWIEDTIKQMEHGHIPDIANIKNHDFSQDECGFINIEKMQESYLVKVKDQALCITNEQSYTKWFRAYADYVITCVQWKLDKME